MSGSALFMLIASWTVISVLTAWFFWRVLRTPQVRDPDIAKNGQAGGTSNRDDS